MACTYKYVRDFIEASSVGMAPSNWFLPKALFYYYQNEGSFRYFRSLVYKRNKQTNKQTKPNKKLHSQKLKGRHLPKFSGDGAREHVVSEIPVFSTKKKVFVRGLKRHPQMHHGNLQFLKTRH